MEYFKEYMKGKWKALNDILCLFEKKKLHLCCINYKNDILKKKKL